MTASAEEHRHVASDAERLRASFKQISADGVAVADALYKNLFEASPEIRTLFDGVDLANQRHMLIGSLHYIVMNYERRGVLHRTLRKLGERHVGYGTKHEHYPIFENCLIDAIARVSGLDWNEELEALWRRACREVTVIMTASDPAAPPSRQTGS